MAFDPSAEALTDIASPWFHLLMCDKSIVNNDLIMGESVDKWEDKPGTGNAKNGYRKRYHLYEPSNVLAELSIKEDVWHHHIPFTIEDFYDICAEMYEDWILPRNGSNIIRPRKHPIESSIIGTISTLTQGNSFKTTEFGLKIDDSLIKLDFERNLTLMNRIFDYEMSWPNAQERMFLCLLNDDFESPILLDCTDCKLLQSHDRNTARMYYSWKCKQAYRNMIVCDNKGEIRAVASAPAGWNNDQSLLRLCDFFNTGFLSPNESAIGDGAFTGNQDFQIDRPFTQPQLANDPTLLSYNQAIAKYRQLIERINGSLKQMFKILSHEFKMRRHLFPLVFRVCCLMLNRYGRLYGYPVKDQE